MVEAKTKVRFSELSFHHFKNKNKIESKDLSMVVSISGIVEPLSI